MSRSIEARQRSYQTQKLSLEVCERRDLLATDLLGSLADSVAESSNPADFFVAGDQLYFAASDEAPDIRLWRTDGSEAGTTRVDGSSQIVGTLGDQFFYERAGGLFAIGPDTTTPTNVFDESQSMISPRRTLEFKDHLYFVGRGDEGEIRSSRGIMRTDGEQSGYLVVPPRSTFPELVGVWNDRLYFSYAGSAFPDRYELWSTDGTAEGTMPVETPNKEMEDIEFHIEYDGQLFGEAEADVLGTTQLAVMDGASFETNYFDLNPSDPLNTSSAGGFVETPVGLFFTANTVEHGFELWYSDGQTLLSGNAANEEGIKVYATAAQTDAIGIATNTRMVADVVPGEMGSDPRWLTWFNDALYFSADRQLWRHSPTEGTTTAVFQFSTHPTSADPAWLTVVDDVLYFSADNGMGSELWSSDGTTAGTQLIADMMPGDQSGDPSWLVDFQGQLVFAANTQDVGRELYAWDADNQVPALIRDINTAESGELLFPANPFLFNDRVYFSVNDGSGIGWELWSTDGRSEPQLVKDINPGVGSSSPRDFVAVQDWLYFVANDGEHGFELWRTDGTAANTNLVKDIWVGRDALVRGPFVVFQDDLYFQAKDEAHGVELWKTDGTEAGTELVVDLRAGVAGSDIVAVTTNDEWLFVYDEYLGREPGIERAVYRWDGEEVVKFVDTQEIGRHPVADLQATRDHLFIAADRSLDRFDLHSPFDAEIGQLSDDLQLPLATFGLKLLNQGTSAVALGTRGVYAFDEFADEAVLADGSNVEAAFATEDFVIWYNRRISGTIRSLEAGERIPTVLVEDMDIWAIHQDSNANEIFAELIDDEGNRQLWRLDASPLKTGPIQDLDGATRAVIADGDRIFYIGTAARGGDSLFLIDNVQEAQAALAEEPVPIVGDIDLDGKVDFADFLILSTNFGLRDAERAEGDLDGDSQVTFTDFLVLSTNFGR